MTFLKFFLEFGKNGLGFLWVIYGGLSVWFLYQAYVGYKSGWYKNTPGGNTSSKTKLKWYEYHKFSFLWGGITIAAIIIHFIIRSDYK